MHQEERDTASDKMMRLEASMTEQQRMINRANAAARAANKEDAAAVFELKAQVQRLQGGLGHLGPRPGGREKARAGRGGAPCLHKSTILPS
eukprot:6200371-Pleurochrysis_carterae.AAC.2